MNSILELNQDCLNKIFEYLNIYELIDIEDTCSAFKITCNIVYKSKKFQKYRIELRYLKIEYIESIFDRIGSTLKEFEFSGGYTMKEEDKMNLINGISNCSKKLSKLSLNYVNFNQNIFENLQKIFTNLTHLDLSRCCIKETKIESLNGRKLEKIKILKLAGNVEMEGSFFNTMSSVQVLDVSYCYNLKYFYFFQFLQNCSKLIELDVTASCQVIPDDQDILQDLLQYQPNIQKLTMDNVGLERNDEILSKFMNLQHASFAGRKFGT
jgi:hypothetical protein